MSEDLAKSLNEKRLNAVSQMREIAERSKGERNEEERAEDAAAFKRAADEVDRLKVQIDGLVKEARESKELDEAINTAFRSGVAGSAPAGDKNEPTWIEELRAAVGKHEARTGTTFEDAEVRAILAGTATKGAETVPSSLANELYRKLFQDGALLSAGVRVISTGGGNAITFPRLATRGEETSRSNWTRSENTQIHLNAGPTFDTVTLNAYGYGEIQQISREATEDSQFDLQALMGEIIGQNIANYLDKDFTNGSGTNQPRGLLTVVGSNVVTPSGTGKFVPQSFDDLLDLVYKLDPRFRRNGKFLMQDQTTLPLRKLKQSTDGAATSNMYAWQPSQVAGAPDTLLGYPVVIDPYMPATGAGNVSLVFADFSKFYVRMVNSVRVEWSTEYAWDYDLISVKAVVRADSDSIDDSAFAGFKGTAT